MSRKRLFRFAPVVLIILIGAIGLLPFFKTGFFTTHDGEWMIIRFSDFHRSLVDGQLPVRWAGRLNFGYGYPVFNFLYPGTFYFTEVFHLIKLNFTDSVKAAFAVSFLLSGFFMYLFIKEISGRLSGVLSAVLYMFTPYRFVDMYVRGSLGESVSFIFPPFILYSIHKLFSGKSSLFWCAVVSVGIAGLITTHNVIAYLFMPIIILYGIYLLKRDGNTDSVWKFITSVVLGIGLSAYFWLPAIIEKKYTVFDSVLVSDFTANFPDIKSLILPSWGYGPSRPGDPSSMSFQIGTVNILVFAFCAVLLAVNLIKSKKRIDKIAGISFMVIAASVYTFFLTGLSKGMWFMIPLLPLIQFPWRILSVTTFLTACMAGLLVPQFGRGMRRFLAASVLIMAAVFLNLSYIKPEGFVNRPDGYYSTNEDTTTVQNEYMPKGAVNLPKERAGGKVEILNGSGAANIIKQKSNFLEFTYSGSPATVKINTAYFPGWKAFVNDKPQEINVDGNGLINIDLSNGISDVKLRFAETPLREISNIISVLSLITIILFIFNTQLTMILHSIIVKLRRRYHENKY